MPDTGTEKHFFRLYAEFEYKLDSQRRIAVPAVWRAENPGGHFTLIRARDGILQLYPEQAFNERYGAVLMKLRTGNAEDMKLARDFGSNCISCVCDTQGRIQFPKDLLEKAGIKSRMAMIGCGNLIQLMAGEKREAELKASEENGSSDSYMNVLDM